MKPCTFAQFYALQYGTMQEVLGSDGVAYLDGRKDRLGQMEQAVAVAVSRSKVKRIDGYRICRGTHTDHIHLTTMRLIAQ